MTEDELVTAHEHSWRHRAELEASTVCGCFCCLAVYPPAEISTWIENDTCALCPRCEIDAVIGDASGLPVTTASFLREMHERWFSGM